MSLINQSALLDYGAYGIGLLLFTNIYSQAHIRAQQGAVHDEGLRLGEMCFGSDMSVYPVSQESECC